MASPAPNTSSAAPASAPAPTAAPTSAAPSGEPMPSSIALLQAARLAMNQDKQIALDYFVDTLKGKAFIAEDPESKEKVLVKSRDEYTSQVSKMYRAGTDAGDDFLIVTENTIYIVSAKIQKRRFPHSSLHQDDE